MKVMATENVTIDVNIYWDRDEPDGSECICCGDRCYLSMWRLVVSAVKFVSRTKTEHILCEACHNALMKGQ